MSEAARLPLHRRPAFWAGGIFAAFGIISALRMTDAIGSTTGFILMVIAMLQIIPLTRASLAKQRSTGHLSPATSCSPASATCSASASRSRSRTGSI